MKTEIILIEKIISITAMIKEKHPELMRFIDEMPITIPDENNPQLNTTALIEYYNSLNDLLKKYDIQHPF
jgi:hypothetical protein